MHNPERRFGYLLGCRHIFQNILTQIPAFENLLESVCRHTAGRIQIVHHSVIVSGSVTHQDVDSTEFLQTDLRHPFDIFVDGYVCPDSQGSTTSCLDFLHGFVDGAWQSFSFFSRAGCHHHIGTLLSQCQADLLADTCAATCCDGGLAFEFHSSTSLSRIRCIGGIRALSSLNGSTLSRGGSM